MSEQEKRSLGVMCEAANRMKDFQLGVFVGIGESMAEFKEWLERIERERGEQDELKERA